MLVMHYLMLSTVEVFARASASGVILSGKTPFFVRQARVLCVHAQVSRKEMCISQVHHPLIRQVFTRKRSFAFKEDNTLKSQQIAPSRGVLHFYYLIHRDSDNVNCWSSLVPTNIPRSASSFLKRKRAGEGASSHFVLDDMLRSHQRPTAMSNGRTNPREGSCHEDTEYKALHVISACPSNEH